MNKLHFHRPHNWHALNVQIQMSTFRCGDYVWKKGHHENYMKSSLQQDEEKNAIYFSGPMVAKWERGAKPTAKIETCRPVKKKGDERFTGIAIIDESCTHFAVDRQHKNYLNKMDSTCLIHISIYRMVWYGIVYLHILPWCSVYRFLHPKIVVYCNAIIK